jgi:hypothetical protein
VTVPRYSQHHYHHHHHQQQQVNLHMTEQAVGDRLAKKSFDVPIKSPMTSPAKRAATSYAYSTENDCSQEVAEEPLTAASVFPEDDNDDDDDGDEDKVAVSSDIFSKDAVEFVHVSAEAAHNAAVAAAAASTVTPEPAEFFSSITGKDIPETPQEVELVDQMLAQEFNQLSMEEKDRILFEIHGIASDEDPDDLGSYYKDLERHLGEIPEKKELEAAKYYNADFVKNNRLAFLRALRFNAKEAAERMVVHFRSKQELFGEGEILAREIRYSDLCEGSIKMLESGFMQILPQRDAAGRSIMFVRPELKHKMMQNIPSHEQEVCATKAMWYMLSTTLQDEETQKKGIVVVLVGKRQCLDNDIRIMQKFHEARESLPKKVVGIHLCSDDLSLPILMASTKLHVMTKEMRMHFRPHIYADPKQIIFELQTFGIPITEEYLKMDSTVNLSWLREWLEIRKSQEQESKESPAGVIVPRKFDVLFGRGKNNREHTGNMRCTLLVEMHMEQYEKASKYEKTMIAERIMSMVEESLGRFLKYEVKKGWIEVSREEAREKVSHFFRFQRSKNTARSKPDEDLDAEPSATIQTQHAKRVTPSVSPELVPQQSSIKRAVKRRSFNEETLATP